MTVDGLFSGEVRGRGLAKFRASPASLSAGGYPATKQAPPR